MAVEPCKPMRIFYLEEIENSDTLKIIIQESSRLWNDATDQPLYNKAKEEYYSFVHFYDFNQSLNFIE